jgi:glycosyltransferase involved in cell wall biosynthesis
MSYEYGLLKKELEDYAKGLSGRGVPEGKTSPVDIVILEWTGMLLLIPDIKKFFPEAKIVCMEEDVFFQRLGRQYRAEKNLFKKRYFYDIYRTGKNLELSGLSKCDKIVVYSTKDRELLEKGGIESEKIYVTAPYYDNYGIQDEAGEAKEDAKPESESTIKSESEAAHFEHPFIMFYGAMFRPENIDCAKRIIEGIMPALSKTDIELEIVGKTNDDSLKKYENDKIHIRGFVEDVGTYFKNCLCFAAPLSQGAGIKIKTLEALSAGTTVLTNEIGMEGIPASAGRDYYHCRSVNDFTNTIIGLYMGSKKPTGESATRFMEETYNLDRNASEFAVMIEAL